MPNSPGAPRPDYRDPVTGGVVNQYHGGERVLLAKIVGVFPDTEKR